MVLVGGGDELADREVTTKFRVDISDLKRNITEANNQMKLANAQFKATASTMENWSTSADGLSAKIRQMTSVVDAQKSKLNAYKQQLALVQSAYAENGRRAQELRTQMAQLIDDGVDPASDEYREYQRALQEVTREQDANQRSANQLQVTILNQEAAINNTERELHQYETALDNLDNAQDDAADSADDLDESIEDAGDAVEEANRGFTVLKGALASLVADGIRLAISAMKDLAKETFEVGSGFESAMSKVEAVSGATSGEIALLTDKAKEMGESTVFSASQSAEAFNYMAMAGWKTEDMLGGIEGIMNLAAASGEDLASTSDIVTDALTAMGYSAKDSGQLADVMAAASSNANTNVKLMGQTFQYAAPIVGALGYNMEDTAVAIGLMANAGIKGEKSGTALRSILTRLSAPPKECAEAMEQLGISLTDSEGNMKSLDQVMQDLRGAFANLSETEQTSAAKHIAGQEAMSGLLAVVRAAPEDYDKLTKAVRNSSGAASNMAKIMTQNVTGQITLLRSKIEGIMIKVFEKASSSIRKAIDTISKALDQVDWDAFANSAGNAAEKVADFFAFVAKNGSTIVNVLKEIAIAFVTYKAVTTITSVVKAFQTLFTALRAGQTVVEVFNNVLGMNPYALVAAAVAALGLALWDFIKAQREAIASEYGLSSAQKDSVESAKRLADAYNEMDSARQQSMQAIFTEYGYINELKDEYNSLIDENGKVKEGYEDRAEVILNQLASALGVEREEIQKNIDANGKLGESIDALIQKKQAEAVLAANQDAYTQAIQNRDEALKTYQTSLNTLTDAEKKYQDSVDESGNVLDKYLGMLKTSPSSANDFYWANQDVIKGQEEAKKAIEEAKKGLEDSETAYLGYVNTISNYEGLSAAIVSGDADAISTAMLAIRNSFITAENGTKESLEKQLENAKQNYADMKQAAADGIAGVTDETVAQAEQMVKMSEQELTKYNSIFVKTFDDIEKLCNNAGVAIPQSVADGIKNGEYALPQSVEEMQSLITYDSMMSEASEAGEEVPEYIAQGVKDGKMKPSKAVEKMNDLVKYNKLLKDAKKAGISVPKEITDGVKSGKKSPADAISQINALMKKETDNAVSSLNKAGKDVGLSYANGVKSNSGNAKSAGESLKSNAKNGATGSLSSEGSNAGGTYASGVSSQGGNARNAGSSLHQNAAAGSSGSLSPQGQGAGSSYSSGVSSQSGSAYGAGSSLKSNAAAGVAGGYSAFFAEGQNAGQGFSDGVSSLAQAAAGAAALLVRNAINAAKAEQASASPSKIWRREIGAMAGEGYIVGLADKIRPAMSEAKTLVKDSIQAASNEMKKSRFGFGNLGENLVGGAMSAAGSLASPVTGYIGSGQSGMVSSGNIITYNQTINAPRTPSRIELYRQTRNLLEYAKGGA